MFKKSFVVVALLACFAGTAAADIVSPDSSYVTVQFAVPSQDRLTISPNGAGETFAANGMTIKVYLKNGAGAPLAGVAATEIILHSSALCICPGGNIADAATDLNGATSFSGTLAASGCANSLNCFADGISIPRRANPSLVPPATLGAVKTNSQDSQPDCFTDASDVPALAGKLGTVGDPCFDWNEDGATDQSEVSSFAQVLGAACL
jgi:hypothetical protein